MLHLLGHLLHGLLILGHLLKLVGHVIEGLNRAADFVGAIGGNAHIIQFDADGKIKRTINASEKVGFVGWGSPVVERSGEAGCCLRVLAALPAAPRTLVSEPWITS